MLKIKWSFRLASISIVVLFAFGVQVSPAAALTNLLTNPGAETGDFTGWTKVNGGNGWIASGFARSGSYSFLSSYSYGTLSQEINLADQGYSDAAMDAQPQIDASTYVRGYDAGSGTNDFYQFKVILRDSNHNALVTYDTGVQQLAASSTVWVNLSNTFTNYGTGVRYIYFEVRGKDSSFWAGQYGSAFDDSVLTVANPHTLTYTAGMHGSITGSTTQVVNDGMDGTAVTAVPEMGYTFVNWSDSSTANPRTDTSVTGDISVTANFADSTIPSVTTFSPLDGATSVSTTSNLVLTFTEAVTTQTGNITLKKVTDNSTVETIAANSSAVTGSGSTTITINPTQTLAALTEYYVQIDSTAFADQNSNFYTGINTTTTWNFTTANQSPVAQAGADQTVDEADTVTLDASGSTDSDGETLTYTWYETRDVSDACSLNAATTVRPTLTLLNKNSNYDCAYGVTVNDGHTDSTADTVNIYVTANNDTPTFSGQLPSVSFTTGQTATAVFNLQEYFSDVDLEDSALSYSVAANDHITATITDGIVTLGAVENYLGTTDVVFQATDISGAVADSNTVAVVVTPSTTQDSTIDYLTGAMTGKGEVTVHYDDGQHYTFTAFPKGGAIPRVMEIDDQLYVAVVKATTGTTLHIYNSIGELQLNQYISPKLHYRKIGMGELDGNKDTAEIVVATRRGLQIYFKAYSYNPETDKCILRKRTTHKVKGNYRVKINDQVASLIMNGKGKTVFTWQPFAD